MPPLDFDIPELALITLKGLIALTIIIGLIDTAFAMLAAAQQGVFKWAFAVSWLIDHGKIWLAIILLGVLGTGISTLDVPPIHVAYLAAQAGLALYVGNTIKSMAVNARDSSVPEPKTP
jgi:uncharacterized membrane protein